MTVTTYVALLRGINVGGNHKVPMAGVRDVVAAAGGSDAVTYIQSGNVVFAHSSRSAGTLEAELTRRLEDEHGFAVPVIVRTAAQIATIVRRNPHPDAEPTHRHVSFLPEPPDPAAIEALDVPSFAPETLEVDGREIFLYVPDGLGRSKLAVSLARVNTLGTTRNWRTVLKLHELASAV